MLTNSHLSPGIVERNHVAARTSIVSGQHFHSFPMVVDPLSLAPKVFGFVDHLFGSHCENNDFHRWILHPCLPPVNVQTDPSLLIPSHMSSFRRTGSG